MSLLRTLLRGALKLVPDKVIYITSLEINAKRISYKKQLLRCHGANLELADSAFIMCPDHVTLGDNCFVNEFVHILGGGGLRCGNGVWIANHASIITSTHPTDVEYIGDHPQIDVPIYIEDNVWIGSHAVILPGTKLGRSCIVGAGAVVTKDVPAFAVVGGIPAKVLRYKSARAISKLEAR